MLAESVASGGATAVALDLFGDVDTRAAAAAWHDIGSGAQLALDGAALLDALARLADEGDVDAWVAGSGFEARPDLLARGATLLPLLGNPPEVVRRVRTPGWFYPWLAARRVPHAAVSVAPPVQPEGWLSKDARACGGWHVRPALTAVPGGGAGHYFQRRIEGVPMSVLFLADGHRWHIAGIARQTIRPLGGHQYVHRGGVGPIDLPAAALDALRAMVDSIVGGLGLVGLNGIDFILHEDGPLLIELNPRPTASVALFDDCVHGELLLAHAAVCRGAALDALRFQPLRAVRGSEVVFAPHAGRIDDETADWLAGQGWCHDLPVAGTAHAWGDPVCSVSARAESTAEVERLLAERRRAVLDAVAHAASAS